MPLFRERHNHHEVRKVEAGRYEVDGQVLSLESQQLSPHEMLLRHDGQQKRLFALHQGDKLQAWYGGEFYEVHIQTRKAAAEENQLSPQINAPLTGKVIEVPVSIDQEVEKGFALVILESMKMETSLSAPADARVKAIHCQAGDQVSTGQVLVELDYLDQDSTQQDSVQNEDQDKT